MKVYSFKIPKKPGQNLLLQRDKGPMFFDKLHQHEEIQISKVLSGSGKLIVGDSVHSFESGDGFVIGGGIPHLFKSAVDTEQSHMLSLFFAHDAFGTSFFESKEMEALKNFFSSAEMGFKVLPKERSLLNDMETMFSMGQFSKFVMLLQLLKELNDSEKTMLSGFIPQKEISDDQGERLRAVFDFVMQHFNQKIDLETISGLAHMTPNAFCRFFKQRTNKTFFKFLIEVRIEHACQLLIHNRDLSVAEAAHASGFHSISNFNKKFREIKGTNPSNYLLQIS